MGSGKNFLGVVDLLTNQKLMWTQKSVEDDGRKFISEPLKLSDDPDLLEEVSAARAALIEQVCSAASRAIWTEIFKSRFQM